MHLPPLIDAAGGQQVLHPVRERLASLVPTATQATGGLTPLRYQAATFRVLLADAEAR
jgi:hypothetical protein